MSLARPILFSAGVPRALERLSLEGRGLAECGPGYTERWLQDLIQHCPEVLPTEEIEPGFGRLIPVATEVTCGHGRIDNLFVTPEGGVALVETKLWRNPEARRMVVSQALDYAAALSRMSYNDFEQAALSGEFPPDRPKPSSIYELVANQADARDEAKFIDAVTLNLRRGRMLVIAAGDGIRTEAEALADLLQSHAGARFTFALVAIELFQGPDEQILAVPRTIAKTVLIERGVVRIEGGQAVVDPPTLTLGKSVGQRTTMTEELFLELMASRGAGLPTALRQFLSKASTLGVKPDWQASLNLKWYSDRAVVNLGYLRKDGSVATDATYYTAKGAAPALRYLERFAALTGGKLVQNNESVGPYVIAGDGRGGPRIEQLLPAKMDAWIDIMKTFVEEMEVLSVSGLA